MKAKREIIGGESRHVERAWLTIIAIVAVFGAMFVKAVLLGEFAWHGGV